MWPLTQSFHVFNNLNQKYIIYINCYIILILKYTIIYIKINTCKWLFYTIFIKYTFIDINILILRYYILQNIYIKV